MKIQVIKKGSKWIVRESCPWLVEVPTDSTK